MRFDYMLAYSAVRRTDTPLDIVICLTTLSSWETVNMKDNWGATALDDAVLNNNTSIALYLSWLGAESGQENRQHREVTLTSWLEFGCEQEAQFWAVAANDVKVLKQLARMENIRLDRERLRNLAKLFVNQKVLDFVSDEL